ncbi:GTP-binding nuclear protein gsp1/Ran [Penicillium hetheringtonii]|uniref:GTP-binding nuclear protein gsp1/Ran n=1 Tax=Penicillium hetheringtonii TaxID=911720 RepID=A0AAD6DAK4_9EURO|nr:GTP-binding nuclear protein gsp1/Ran [Penicillium hetheringtonii]
MFQQLITKVVCTIGVCTFGIWDISGSYSTSQDRANWIEDSDAAIIMILEEILSPQQHSDIPKHLPIMVFVYKVYEDDTKYKIKPTDISWPEEMGSTTFHYNEYRDTTNWERDEIFFLSYS